MPLVSVIIPYYRGEAFIAQTLDSLLAATEVRLEIIVVDDGSPAASLTALEPYRAHLTLLTQSNAGQASARNRGIRQAHGAYLALIDQDDLWPRARLAHLLPLLEGVSGHDYARGLTQEFSAQEQQVQLLGAPRWQPSLVGAALYRPSVFATIGLFDESLRAGEDFDWNTRLNESTCRGARTDATTLLCRKHANNQSGAPGYIKEGQMRALKKKLDRMRAIPQ